MKPWMRVGLVVLVMQAGAFLVYRDRAPALPPTGFAVQRLNTAQVAPPLALERRSGQQAGDGAGRWRLIHFWATWCPPCKRELPGVLALARTSTVLEVLPVAVDPAWPELDRFFDGAVPPEVLRLRNDEALARFGTTTLPDSYVVSPEGLLVARIAGERVWDGPRARVALIAIVEAATKSALKEIAP